MVKQTTISKEVKIEGVSLHTGKPATLLIKPAEPNTGYVFVRTDIKIILRFRLLQKMLLILQEVQLLVKMVLMLVQ